MNDIRSNSIDSSKCAQNLRVQNKEDVVGKWRKTGRRGGFSELYRNYEYVDVVVFYGNRKWQSHVIHCELQLSTWGCNLTMSLSIIMKM